MRDKGKRALRRPLSPLLLSPRSLGALYRRDLVLSYKSVAVAIASVAGRLHFRPQPVLRGDQEPPPPAATTNVVCVRTPLALFGVVTKV